MHPRFGTDGVRGPANRTVTPELALALGRAVVRVLESNRVAVGRDTRLSGPMLEAAVLAGVCAEGATASPLGIVPTPAVAHAARTGECAGIMISASHNPFADNGLKVFGPGGRKLTDAEQELVEQELGRLLDGSSGGEPGAPAVPEGADVGSVRPDPDAVAAYEASVLAALEGRSLDGLHLVLDCANGSNSVIGPRLLSAAGARVEAICTEPDGTNINRDCGSTHPEDLSAAVVAARADAGFAFDGDADRLVAVDGSGEVVDGDQLLAMSALDMHGRGVLRHDTLVVTVMSNLGLRQAMGAAGIAVLDTAVGDRFVLDALDRGGFSLGGEQSGHLIFSDVSTTGDGLLSAALVADLVCRSGRTLGELARDSMTRLPQVLDNVAVDAPRPEVATEIAGALAEVESGLGGRGRVLVRPSGTEPVVRVMAEAPTEAEARSAVDALVAAVRALAATQGGSGAGAKGSAR